MSLGLPAGRYAVNLQQDIDYMGATVVLSKGKREKITLDNFKSVTAEQTVLRGEIKRSGTCESGDAIACSLDSLDKYGRYHTTFNFIDSDNEPRKGLQVGLLITRTRDYMLGSQLSLIGNIAQKEMHGSQITTGGNIARHHFQGVQISTTFNYARSFDGVQASSAVNVSKYKSSGVQVGIVN